KKGSKDHRRSTGDASSEPTSVSLRMTFNEMLSRAEMLAPGVRLPTFDAEVPARHTMDMMCAFKRQVLGQSYRTDDGRSAIDPFLGGKRADFTPKAMSCDAIATVFAGSSELIRRT